MPLRKYVEKGVMGKISTARPVLPNGRMDQNNMRSVKETAKQNFSNIKH